ncbi:casein kinase II, regulatory subunit [Gaertneriomyces semiglobifer]|nr:casein kinase II, regulatory subunit [Gaertneriomyces semiglobifer]
MAEEKSLLSVTISDCSESRYFERHPPEDHDCGVQEHGLTNTFDVPLRDEGVDGTTSDAASMAGSECQSSIARMHELALSLQHSIDAKVHSSAYRFPDEGGTFEGDEDETSEELEESGDESDGSGASWIGWYCSLPGHELLCEVPQEFIEDDFNLTGLASRVPYYPAALDLILDFEPVEPPPMHATMVESSAEMLYGLIHARYIVTKAGLQAMMEKYRYRHFGMCPREGCGGVGVVPSGISDREGKVRFHSVDGAFFGTTFAHLLFTVYPDLLPPLIPQHTQARGSQTSVYSPNDSDEEDIIYAASSHSLTLSDPEEPTRMATTGAGRRSSPDGDEAVDEVGSDEEEAEWREYLTSLPPYKIYTQRIFGFRVNERSKVGPRMRWLRVRAGIRARGSGGGE